MEAPHVPDAPGGVLQHRVDIGAEFRRVDGRLLPLPGPKAVLQEIGETALGLSVDLGSGQIQSFAVKPLHAVPGHSSQAVILSVLRLPVAGKHRQPFRQLPGIPPGKINTRLGFVRLGKAGNARKLPLASRQFCQPVIQEGGLLPGTADKNGLLRPAEYAVNLREFRLNALHRAAGQGYSQGAQLHPLLIRQHAGGAAVARKLSFLRAQHDQMLLPVAAHSVHRPHLHRIQHRRNGSHIVLAQQQPQKPHKMLRLPGRVPQHRVHLFQGGNEDFPQLIQNLSLPGLPAFLQLLGKAYEPFLQRNFFQESVQPQNLLLKTPCLPEPVLQSDKGGDGQFPRLVQFRQLVLGIFIPHAAQTLRMPRPGILPGLSPDSPGDGVIFHPVTGVHIQRR